MVSLNVNMLVNVLWQYGFRSQRMHDLNISFTHAGGDLFKHFERLDSVVPILPEVNVMICIMA